MKYKNNPFNIRSGSRWLGLTGNRRGFCEFDTLEHGIRAACILLLRSYRKKGVIRVSSIVSRYAPPSENNVNAYLHFIESMYGLPRNLILTSRLQYAKLLAAMAYFESHTSISVSTILNVISIYNIVFCLTPKKV